MEGLILLGLVWAIVGGLGFLICGLYAVMEEDTDYAIGAVALLLLPLTLVIVLILVVSQVFGLAAEGFKREMVQVEREREYQQSLAVQSEDGESF